MGHIIVTDRQGDTTDFEGSLVDYDNLIIAMSRGDTLAFRDELTGNRITYASGAILHIKYEADQPVPPPVPASEVVDGNV